MFSYFIMIFLIFSISVLSINFMGDKVLNVWRVNIKCVFIVVFYGCYIMIFLNLELEDFIFNVVIMCFKNLIVFYFFLLFSW